MKIFCIVLLLLVAAGNLSAQDSLAGITELQQLLQERRDRFQQYADAADKRSGIFKMKTKKDLEQSREILLSIVSLDNQIMGQLNRVITSRGMAKADYTPELLENRQTIERLSNASDTLYKQLQASEQVIGSLQKQTTRQRWIPFLLVGLTLILSFIFFIRRRK